MNAVIEPTCIEPPSIRWAATQTIRIVRLYIISIMTGIMNVITRLTNRLVLVRFWLAVSNRFSSVFSLPNARITDSPVRISRETRFTRSTSVCIFLNFGMAMDIRTPTMPRMTSTAKAMTQPMPAPVLTTFRIPPIPKIGAYSSIRRKIAVTICTCWMSLVLRVIREAVEN